MTRRRLLLEQGELPSGYRRCKYLESTGTQYIDTEFAPNGEKDFETSFYIVSYSTYSWVFGSRTAQKVNRFDLGFGGSIVYYGFNTTSRNIYSGGLVNNTYFFKYKDNTLSCFVNNTESTNSPLQIAKYGVNSGVNIFLFAINTNNTAQYLSRIKLYNLTFYENNKPIRKYIPCLDKNGVPCIYESVEKKTLYNKGTGEFLYELE